jgi:membrane-associated protease RseP (regulator of RpoE activity)
MLPTPRVFPSIVVALPVVALLALAGWKATPPLNFTPTRAVRNHVINYEVRLSALENSDWSRDIRLVPVLCHPNGGVRIYAVRPQSTLWQLGLRNGDRIVSIDGLPLRHADDALALYIHARNLDRIAVEIDRGGIRHILRYHLIR